MLHRLTPRGTIVMSQLTHAWVSGQMARAWSDSFEPRAAVELAAELHDIGWTEWEQRPTFNAKTGLPHAFLELQTADHLAIWTGAGRRVESISMLAAVLVSRHGTGLYERFHTEAEAQAEPGVQTYLEHERSAQQAWLGRLRRDPILAERLDAPLLDHASRLIAAWDWLSLLVCMNESARGEVRDVPWRDGRIDLVVSRSDDCRWTVAPWPFVGTALEVVAEGRLMAEPAASEADMRATLAQAPPVTVRIRLEPGA